MSLGTNLTTTGGLNAAVATYYDRQFLDRLEKEMHFDEFGQKKSLPKGSGTTIQFQRFTNFAANTTALTEGTVPNGLTMASSTIQAIPLQYGDYVALSDRLILEAIDPIVKDALDLLSYRAALSMDTLIRNTLHGNVTYQFAGGDANEAAEAHVVNAAELRKARFTLKNAAVRPVDGENYALIASPASVFDLQSDSAVGGFLDLNKYTTPTPMYKGELGKMWGIRIVESQNVDTGTGAASANTYRNFVFGKNGYGIVDLAGMGNVKTITKQLGSSGVSDPLDQISTVGYKFWHVTKVLDSARIIELVGTSAAA